MLADQLDATAHARPDLGGSCGRERFDLGEAFGERMRFGRGRGHLRPTIERLGRPRIDVAERVEVLGVGELLWDLFLDGPRLGGAPFNVTANLRRLGHRAAFVTAVGDDDLGRRALTAADQLGVEATFISKALDLPTGTVDVAPDPASGHRCDPVTGGLRVDRKWRCAGREDPRMGAGRSHLRDPGAALRRRARAHAPDRHREPPQASPV